MNSNHSMLLASVAALSLCAATSPTTNQLQQHPAQGLARVEPAPQTAVEAAPQAAFEADSWKQKLVATDLDQRERNFDELVQRARNEPAVRDALQAWSHSDQRELAWNARMALRELDRSNPHFARRGTLDAPGWSDLRSRLDELERQFGGMDSMFQNFGQSFPTNPGWNAAPNGSGNGSTHSQHSYTMQVGPDGVSVESSEDVDGKQETKTYKAKSLDELYEQYPELKNKLGVQGSLHTDGQGAWQLFGGGQPFNWNLDDSQGFGQLFRPLSGTPQTDILGIECTKLAPERASALGLQAEQGLRVERVVPGTIAQIIGLRRGDVVVELNQKPIYSSDDIKSALAERKADQEVVVTIIDGKDQRRTLRWKPSEPNNESMPAPKNDPRPPTKGLHKL